MIITDKLFEEEKNLTIRCQKHQSRINYSHGNSRLILGNER